MSDSSHASRRAFLQRLSALGLAGLGGSTLLAGCGGGGEQPTTTDDQATADTEAGGDDFTCTDTSGLTEAEVQMRETLAYVDETPFPDKRCDNCQLYLPPEAGAQCGGCQVLKGPVHPQGYCNSWAAQVS